MSYWWRYDNLAGGGSVTPPPVLYSNFDSPTGANKNLTDVTETIAHELGYLANILLTGSIVGLRSWGGFNVGTPLTLSLWSTSGTLLARSTISSLMLGPNTVSITPVAVTAGSQVIVTAGLNRRRIENIVENPYVGSAGVRFVARLYSIPNAIGSFPIIQDTAAVAIPVDLILAVPV